MSCTRRPARPEWFTNASCAIATVRCSRRELMRVAEVVTPLPGLLLAGDGVRIDLPVALMERAATTGWAAANHLLTRWGIAGHTLSSVPTQGRSALLRYLAGRERLSR